MPRLEFRLTDQDDRVVSAEDFRSKVVLLYFGYTQCPDECPTKPDARGYYAVDHSSAVFVFDREGRARLLAERTAGSMAIATDLRRLIASE